MEPLTKSKLEELKFVLNQKLMENERKQVELRKEQVCIYEEYNAARDKIILNDRKVV
jgi:hypothetical protein